MALGRIKTEMGRRNGKGRWMPRAEAKRVSKTQRRRADAKAVKEGDAP